MKPGDRCITKESIDYLDNTTQFGKDEPFIKVFSKYIPKIALELSGGAAGIMFMIAPHIAFGSGLLCYMGKGHALNNGDIEELTGLSKKTIIKLMTELVDHKILARCISGRSYKYFVNPYIYCRGGRVNKTLEVMFKDFPCKYKNENM